MDSLVTNHVLGTIADLRTTLQAPLTISVHGEHGTGKSLIGATLAYVIAEASRSLVTFSLAGRGATQQLLNQMVALGIPPYEILLSGRMTAADVFGATESNLRSLLDSYLTDDTVILLEDLHLVRGNAADIERHLLEAAVAAGAHMVVVSAVSPSTDDRRAEIDIDLTLDALQVETGAWDAVMRVRTESRWPDRLVRIGDRALEFDDEVAKA